MTIAHDLSVETLIAIADRQVAQAAGTDRPRHRRSADDAHDGDGETADESRQSLGQEDMPHNMPVDGTPSPERLR